MEVDLGRAQDWTECRSETIEPGARTEITVTDLNPSSSYIFRLSTLASGGEQVGPGPEIAFDTEGTHVPVSAMQSAEWIW